MKKLMIAAATAAMVGGAFASLCEEELNTPAFEKGCAVWNVKVTVKTLGPKKAACKYACDDDDVSYYFENATRKFDGILFQCESECDLSAAKLALWEAKAKTAICPITATTVVDGDKTKIVYSGEENIEFVILDRYSKTAKKVETVWEIQNDVAELVGAGFGSFDTKNYRVSSISGNCAGTVVPAEFVISKKCEDDEYAAGKVLDLCEAFENWCESGDETEAVAASGTWSIKYNKTLSKGKKSLRQIVPAYAIVAE